MVLTLSSEVVHVRQYKSTDRSVNKFFEKDRQTPDDRMASGGLFRRRCCPGLCQNL
jgi:hypothetical protein